MKKHRFSVYLAILLPLMTLLVLGESGIYLGAYFSLRETAYQNVIEADTAALNALCKEMEDANYWGNILNQTIKKYEELAPEKMPEKGSQEEADYIQTMASAATAWIGGNLTKELQTFAASFMGIFLLDNNRNRVVLLISSNGIYQDAQDVANYWENTALYVGAFFDKTPAFEGTNFYGHSLSDANLGSMLASGQFITDLDYGDGTTHPIWAIRETTEKEAYEAIPLFSRTFAIVASAVLVVMLFAAYFILNFAILRPVKKLSDKGNEYTAGLNEGRNEDVFALSNKRYSNEATELNDALFYMQQSIGDYSKRFADLTLASSIQASMVPSAPLEGKNFLVRGYMRPAKEVGGDLYNYFRLDEDHVAFLIGDVSGKGMAAGLFMAKANTILRFAAKDFDIDEANRFLCESNSECFFVTAFMGVLELSTGKLRFVNAGHEPVYLCHNGVYSVLEEESNFMLGCDETMEYISQEIQLDLGDRLFLYTDGISEAMDKDGNLFGRQRILDCLNQIGDLPSADVFPIMMSFVSEFVGEAEQSDDAAVVALDYANEKTLPFAPTREGLASVAPFVDQYLGDKPETFKDEMQVILDELCTNIVLYSGAKSSRLTLRDDGESIVAILMDNGVPFNPLKDKPEHNPDEPGGLGIITASAMSDSIDYRFLEGRNILRISKKYKK